MRDHENRTTERCWKSVGVSGDFTCPELATVAHCRNCQQYALAGRSLLDRETPRGYLEEWQQLLSGSKETEALGMISLVVFRVRQEWLALPTLYFQETADLRPAHTVPLRSNNVFRGVVNINGELLLCVSVADILSLTVETEESPAAEPVRKAVYQRLVVVSKDGERFVFPVDEVLGIRRIAPEAINRIPATLVKTASALSRGVFELGDRTVGLLDEEKFFSALARSLSS